MLPVGTTFQILASCGHLHCFYVFCLMGYNVV